MTEREIIRSSRELAGIMSDRELSEITGLKYSTMMHQRRTDPGSYTLREIRQIIKYTGMSDPMIIALVRGKED